MKADDIIAFVLSEVMRQHPSYTEAEARLLLPKLHAELGGQKYYVQKKSPSLKDDVYRDALGDATNEELQARHSVSRATIYRLMKRGTEP